MIITLCQNMQSQDWFLLPYIQAFILLCHQFVMDVDTECGWLACPFHLHDLYVLEHGANREEHETPPLQPWHLTL